MGLTVVAVIGAWRWWLAPWRERAAKAEGLDAVRAGVRDTLREYDIDVKLDGLKATAEVLSWRAPGECVEVYRVRIDERYRDASVVTFLGRNEEHRTHYLALAGDPRRGSANGITPVIAMLTSADEQPRIRELWWGPRSVGPSAPDFACRRRSWDPLEDALAFGWPRLPARWTWVADSWTGAAVEGRCHETICVDPDGSFGHAVPCRARPWSEQLDGVEGEMALIYGRWDDGHDPDRREIGILTLREAVIDEGRPLYVRAEIDQRWAGVRRELSLVRVDDCGAHSLTNGDPVDETRALFREQIRARLSQPTAD